MYLVNLSSGKKHPAQIEKLENAELKKITRKRYAFSWKVAPGFDIYKLHLENSTDILGLMSLEYFDSEQRIHIRLIAVSSENVGRKKIIDGIAGCLFAFAARLAIKKYGEMAAISLLPKTKLRAHYMINYGFEQAGISLFIEGKKLNELINKYYYDENTV